MWLSLLHTVCVESLRFELGIEEERGRKRKLGRGRKNQRGYKIVQISSAHGLRCPVGEAQKGKKKLTNYYILKKAIPVSWRFDPMLRDVKELVRSIQDKITVAKELGKCLERAGDEREK